MYISSTLVCALLFLFSHNNSLFGLYSCVPYRFSCMHPIHSIQAIMPYIQFTSAIANIDKLICVVASIFFYPFGFLTFSSSFSFFISLPFYVFLRCGLQWFISAVHLPIYKWLMHAMFPPFIWFIV